MFEGLKERFSFLQGNLRVLTIRLIIGMFFRRMVFPYASLFIIAVGGEPAQIGFINSLRPLAGLLMFPLSGYLTDRAGRVRLIALAGYLQGAFMLLYVFAPSWEWIAVGALLQGFMVFQFPPSSAILADSLAPQNRGVGIATMNTIATACSMFSPYIAGLLLEYFDVELGMRILYGLLALQAIVNGVIVQQYLKETSASLSQEPLPSLGRILRDSYSGIPELIQQLPRSVKALGFIAGLGFIMNGVASPFWVVYAIDKIGLNASNWGLIIFIEGVIKTVLTIPAGMICDRYGRKRSLFIALLLSLGAPLFIFASNFTSALLIRLAVGLAGALFMPSSTALMADYLPSNLRGRVMAAIGRGSVLIGAAGGGTGGPGMGYLFVIPVMISSMIGGMLYEVDPSLPWIIALVATIFQILALILFIQEPENAS